MRDGKSLRWLCLSLWAVSLSGCAVSTAKMAPYKPKIESRTSTERHAAINRLLIVSNVWAVPSEEDPSPEQRPVLDVALLKAFGTCGMVTNILPRDQLLLPDGGARATQTFSPDALLVIDLKVSDVGLALRSPMYSIKIVDTRTKEMIWQAQTDIHLGKSEQEILAASIRDRLKKDSILCLL